MEEHTPNEKMSPKVVELFRYVFDGVYDGTAPGLYTIKYLSHDFILHEEKCGSFNVRGNGVSFDFGITYERFSKDVMSASTTLRHAVWLKFGTEDHCRNHVFVDYTGHPYIKSNDCKTVYRILNINSSLYLISTKRHDQTDNLLNPSESIYKLSTDWAIRDIRKIMSHLNGREKTTRKPAQNFIY